MIYSGGRYLPYLGGIIHWSMCQLLMASILLPDCTVPVGLQFEHLLLTFCSIRKMTGTVFWIGSPLPIDSPINILAPDMSSGSWRRPEFKLDLPKEGH